MGGRRPPAVARVLQRVTATARSHELFARGEIVLVCVSGGPDSVCLVESLVRLRRLFRLDLEVFHFDHRLRPGSERDAAYVRALARRLGLPFHLRVAEARPARGESVEAWASLARMRAVGEVRGEIGAGVIAEGHTLDDQAESVLLNLVRGTGLEGLAGILPKAADRSGTVTVQPLLDVERAEVEAFCRALHLRPRRDPMNDDRRLLRNALRLEAIPALERATGRDVRGPIARTAENLRADRAELDAAAVLASRRVVRPKPGAEVSFDVAALRALSPALAARVVRIAAYGVVPDAAAAPWPKAAIDAVLDLAAGRPGRRRDLPGGWVAHRDRSHVVVTRR